MTPLALDKPTPRSCVETATKMSWSGWQSLRRTGCSWLAST